jgi:hypothetical protein
LPSLAGVPSVAPRIEAETDGRVPVLSPAHRILQPGFRDLETGAGGLFKVELS